MLGSTPSYPKFWQNKKNAVVLSACSTGEELAFADG
jgi:hypothetical protein